MVLMRTYGHDELRSMWRTSIWAFLLGLIPLTLLLLFGFPSHLWTPVDGRDLARAFLTIGMVASGSIALGWGPRAAIEDAEVRGQGGGEILNPWSGIISMWVGAALIACIVLAARYVYLMSVENVITYLAIILEIACCIAIVVRFRGSLGALLGGFAFGLWAALSIAMEVSKALEVELWDYRHAIAFAGLAAYGCLLAALITGRTANGT
jgi:hypothetical protein